MQSTICFYFLPTIGIIIFAANCVMNFLPHLPYLFVRKTLLSDPFYLRLFTRRKRRYVEAGKNAGFRQLHAPF